MLLPAAHETTYKIGDFSKLSEIPVKTLRYYDEIGLLRPARVDGTTGYRYYTAVQVERLDRILVFKDLGFSLGEIRALVAENVPPDEIRDRHVNRERPPASTLVRVAGLVRDEFLIEVECVAVPVD